MDLQRELQRHFGFASFRGQQAEVIERFLAGGDALVVMATGEGKSLCYQLPALAGDGLTLVVSPLIALMDDQVAALSKKNLPASCIHSLLDRPEREKRLNAALTGKIKLLYVTPERFRVPGFLQQVRARGVARLAIDEAHCVSHWGHDFRPDYLLLGEIRAQLGMPPCLALTATATPEVQQDIRQVLRLGDDTPLFHTGIERPNLFLSVESCPTEEDKLARLLAVLTATGGPAIVYCALIQDLLRLEDHLRRRGITPLVYHGKLSGHERRQQQLAFQQSQDGLILATNAFGMGVDKPDIRAIVHWQLPRTLEAYYQEIGRAGRDGNAAYCELLYGAEDVQIQRNFVEWANPDRAFLVQISAHIAGLGERLQTLDLDSLRDEFLVKNRHDGRVETCLRLLTTSGCIDGEIGLDLRFLRRPRDEEIQTWIPDEKRRQDLMALLKMVRYASDVNCRKQVIHGHFGFGVDSPCGACDVCTDREAWIGNSMLPIPVLSKPAAPRQNAATASTPLERGDWIEVRGLGLCAVKKVDLAPGRLQVEVEVANDLRRQTLDLQRRKWRRVERT